MAEVADVNDANAECADSTTDVAEETSTVDYPISYVNDPIAENDDSTTGFAEVTSTAIRRRRTWVFKRPRLCRRRSRPRGRIRSRELVVGHVPADACATIVRVGLADYETILNAWRKALSLHNEAVT